MRKMRIVLAMALAFGILGLAVIPASAQSPGVIRAEVDRTSASTDDIVLLTVTVDSLSGLVSEPVLPDMGDFEVVGRSSGTQFGLANGTITILSTYQYQLRPSSPGTQVIGPVSITVNGQTHETEPITVEVSQGTGNPQPPRSQAIPGFPSLPSWPSMPGLPALPSMPSVPASPSGSLDVVEAPPGLNGQDFYVEATIDNHSPYLGQQVLYTFRLYQAVELLQQPDLQLPAFTGLWSEQQDGQVEYRTEAAGRSYGVTELQTVLFPTIVGQATIDPATLTIPGGLFDRGQNLRTQPITLDVKPLPDGAPSSFQGAVGHFTVEALTDKEETEVNETVTIVVTITGDGNIASLSDPDWPNSPEWRAFDSQASVTTQFEDGHFGGQRVYERVLVPTTPGNLELPGIEFSYFDPDSGEYITLTTDPIAVSVAPESGGQPAASLIPTADGANTDSDSPSGLTVVDIRPLKPAPNLWRTGRQPLTQLPTFWLLWAAPLVVMAGHIVWRQQQRRRQLALSSRRQLHAVRKARKALRTAMNGQSDRQLSGGQILMTYLSEKLNRPLSGLTQNGLAELLLAEGVDPGTIQRVRDCLAVSDKGRYAPQDVRLQDGELNAETALVIGELEKSLPPAKQGRLNETLTRLMGR